MLDLISRLFSKTVGPLFFSPNTCRFSELVYLWFETISVHVVVDTNIIIIIYVSIHCELKKNSQNFNENSVFF